MAKIEYENLHGLGEGILMPQLKDQWFLRFAGSDLLFSKEIVRKMAAQVVACSFDYCLNILNISLEQDRFSTDLHDLVKQFNTLSKTSSNADKISFNVGMLDGQGEVIKSFKFSGCTLVGHEFKLDYADSGVARHELKFAFKESKEF